MNKKRLSVVMAGAMLASSVAPVLAADANKVETSAAQKGALANELATKLWKAERFSNDSKRVDSDLVGKSVYAVVRDGKTIADTKEAAVIAATDEGTSNFSTLQNAIKDLLDEVAVGEKVKLVNLGSEKVTEKNDAGEDVELIVSKKALSSKYTDTELKYVVDRELSDLKAHMGGVDSANYKKFINVDKTGYKDGKYTITFGDSSNVDLDGEGKKTIELTTKSDKLNFMQYISKVGSNAAEIKNIEAGVDFADTKGANFKGFATAATAYGDIEDTDDTIYTITAGGNTYELSDLYDAPFLTTNGQNLLDSVKDAIIAGKGITTITTVNGDGNDIEAAVVRFVDENRNAGASSITSTGHTSMSTFTGGKELVADKNGVYKVRVDIANAEKLAAVAKAGKTWNVKTTDYDSYYITSKSRADIKTILEWINNADPKVDVLAGENRYATAVKIAKEVDLVAGPTSTVAEKDIVLVNGRSLVDGLAAAPLASSLSDTNEAPILLTEADKLPTATKRYLKELIDLKENKGITVHIVGGESVVSDSVKKELRDLGLKVERLGGENREATSMAVAEKISDIKGTSIENAFVVGANGEADAMSISGKAAESKTPIIVSGYKGLTEDTLDALEGANVTVLGGETVLSAGEYERIEAVAEKTTRVFGANRKATNAEIINKFYKKSFATAKSVIVAKDDELVDALTASNLSAQQGAPIVLGTKSLSEAQINAVVSNADKANKVYQVGGNVAKEVVKTVAEALNLI